jgi:hypothetical protein
LSDRYNNFAQVCILDKYKYFRKSDAQVLFVMIRDCAEIENIKKAIGKGCITLLVRRNGVGASGNVADDCVENYSYDYNFDNDYSLEVMKPFVFGFFDKIFEENAVELE